MLYQTIYGLSLKNENETITKVLKDIRELKINRVKKLIPNFTINFNFDNETILQEFLEFYDIKPSEKYFDINIKNIVSLSTHETLNYYLKQEIKSDMLIANFAMSEAKKEKERRNEKFITKFLKSHKQLYTVKEREGCHCLLLFAPCQIHKHYLYLNKDNYGRLTEMLRDWPHTVFYIKNKNPRDWKNVSFSYIKILSPASKHI